MTHHSVSVATDARRGIGLTWSGLGLGLGLGSGLGSGFALGIVRAARRGIGLTTCSRGLGGRGGGLGSSSRL